MSTEQRAEVRLTDDERAVIGDAVMTGALIVAVERILADRAAAEDHGLRALIEVAVDRFEYHRRGDIAAATICLHGELLAALDGGA